MGCAIALLAGCGGGSAGSPAADNVRIVDSFGNEVYNGPSGGHSSNGFGPGDSGMDGTAGDGAPIANATVQISGKTGTPVNTTTNAQGYFRAKINGLTPPYVVQVTKPGNAGERYSFSTANPVLNGFVTVDISGLTTLVASDVATALSLGSGASALSPLLLANNAATVTAAVTQSLNNQKAQLATVLGAAGIDPATYNPMSAPFLANSTGYDYLLDNTVITVPASGPVTSSVAPGFEANGIVGTWMGFGGPANSSNASMRFTADGHYIYSQATVSGSPGTNQAWPGIEYGTYTYTAPVGNAPGTLVTSCPIVDTNGQTGFSNVAGNHYTGAGQFDDSGVPQGTCLNQTTAFAVTLDGNSGTLGIAGAVASVTMTRVVDSTRPLIGGWVLDSFSPPNAAPVHSSYVVFGPDGYVTMVQTAVNPGNSSWPGLEWGTYSWNPATGALSMPCPLVDTNGSAGTSGNYSAYTDGLISSGSNPVGTAGGGQPIGTCQNANVARTAVVNGNTLTISSADGVATLSRIIY